ncbi:MAG: DoxX family membrane protein [Chloroflexi bacterium]|nr:DoxX family membrane protein [Chloroflexota bacterium]
MRHDRSAAGSHPLVIQDPPFVQALLAEPRLFAWLWLPIRVYLGWQWLEAGWGKLQSPAWMQGGAALRGFWEQALQTDLGATVANDWYRASVQFLLDTQSYTWLAQLIANGEVLLGIALILGMFTGLAAFGGALLNFDFALAGSAATNPVLFALAIWLMLAWKTAGWWGLDHWLLPLLGTPWQDRVGEPQPSPALIRPSAPAQLWR